MTAADAIAEAIRLLDAGEWLNPYNADLRGGLCARRPDGMPTMHLDPEAVDFCAGGALYRATNRPLLDMPAWPPEWASHANPLLAWPEREAFYRARETLEGLVGMDHGAWNDQPGLTWPEVRGVLVEAQARA